jgi:hypothetical protein
MPLALLLVFLFLLVDLFLRHPYEFPQELPEAVDWFIGHGYLYGLLKCYLPMPGFPTIASTH